MSLRFRRHLLLSFLKKPAVHTLKLVVPESYTGKSFLCYAKYDGTYVSPSDWIIISGNTYAQSNSNGKIDIRTNANNTPIVIQTTYRNITKTATCYITYDAQFSIEAPAQMRGTSGQCIARFDGDVVNPSWSVSSGNAYATINSSGTVTISNTGTITVSATYNNRTTTRNIDVVYEANTSSETIINDDGTVTTTETTTTTDPQTGVTTTTETIVTTNDDGSTNNTNSETITNTDGSSTTTSNTVNADGTSSESTTQVTAPDEQGAVHTTSNTTNYDDNGNVSGSQTVNGTENSDGSSHVSTTNYDASGDPTDTENVMTDTIGNVDTQDIVYDENGDPTVTAYNIDTTNSGGEGKEITGDGVATEFVPFDGSEGFELHIRFYSRKQDQPNPPIVTDTEDTGSNYHFTILCSKDPNAPYPGFHIRWTLSKTNYNSGNLVFGYRGKTGSATNRSLTLSKNNNMYDFTIAYDPKLKKYPSKFRCQDNLNGGAVITLNIDFNPLAYALTLGYNINQRGEPYRYSNVVIHEFTINKL